MNRREGWTGHAIIGVDVRQLLPEGRSLNLVRMVVESFLVTGWHQPWWRGSRVEPAELAVRRRLGYGRGAVLRPRPGTPDLR